MLRILICLLFVSSLTPSCRWRTKDRHDRQATTAAKDSVHLLERLRTYEPKRYRGKVPQPFYDYRGAFDFWRFPIVYPYSIGCIDVHTYGCLYSDEGKTDFEAGGGITPLTDYFDKFIFNRSYFVARKCKTPFDRDTLNVAGQYFIFSFADGAIRKINGAAQLKQKLQEINFSGDTTFMTIDQYGEKL